MNRARIGLLLAAAALAGVPAMAPAQEPNNGRAWNRGNREGGRAEAREERRQQAPTPQPAPVPAPAPAAAPAEAPRAEQPRRAERQDFAQPGRRGSDGPVYRWGGAPAAQPQAQPAPQPAAAPAPVQADAGRFSGNDDRRGGDFRRDGNRGGDDRRDFTRGGEDRRDARNDGPRPDDRGRIDDRRPAPPSANRGNDNRPNWTNGRDARNGARANYNRPVWRNEWRNDRRYDWQSWRTRNQRLFHMPRYAPPRGIGWGYRAFSAGFLLDPWFYAPTYWISDPWDYRLPPVYGPYRWVRYYNDVLLVDIESGEVVDVIRNFFW